MALIECPDCQKEVSDSAPSCPNCGAPISQGAESNRRMCKKCGRETIHKAPKTSHILHFILTIVTAGFWAIVWLIIALNNKTKSKCSVCGNMPGVFG